MKQGHTVIGAELVKKAIEDFFKENNVSYDKENVGGNDYCYTVGKFQNFLIKHWTQ